MKILIITQYYNPEVFRINEVAEYLSENNIQVEIITGLPNYPKGNIYKGYSLIKGPWFEIINKIKVYRVPIVPRLSGKFIFLIFNYISFVITATLFCLFKISKKDQFDSIFVWASSPITSAIPAILLSKKLKIPVNIWIQDLWPESVQAVGATKSDRIINTIGLFVKWIYQNSNLLFIQSKSFSKSLVKWGASPDQIKYLPNWAHPIFEQYQNYQLRNSHDTFKILFAGNLGHAQDIENLMEAINLISSESKIELHFVGTGSKINLIKEKMNQPNFIGKIKIHEHKDVIKMPGFYNEFDSLLISLRKDTTLQLVLPSKMQSYLCSEKPILGIGDGEITEVIKASESGLACKAGSYKDLANNMIKLSKSSFESRKQMGINGKKYYNSNFSKNTLLKNLVQTLENQIKNNDIKRDAA